MSHTKNVPSIRPTSPTSSGEDVPPSPTLSASSVHFKQPEPDHVSHGVPPSSATSFTATQSPTSPPKKGQVDKGDGDDTPAPASDDHTGPAPFAFGPLALAALVDSKTLRDLDGMGGLEGICNGLGTSPTRGLSTHSGAGADEKSGGEGPFGSPFSERQRVYGTNSLPTRPSKSLLQLMWLALKDTVLVR